MKYLTLTIIALICVAGTGCVDLAYRPQPKGSLIKKYNLHDPSPNSQPNVPCYGVPQP